MKKVINGKMYNTETAEKVGEWDNEKYGSYDYYGEELYRKKTGEFFIKAWGVGIEPITEEEAKKWAERLTGEEYEKIFGPVEE